MLILILFAILAGAGTALSPCVLPLLPALLGGRRGWAAPPLGIVLGLSITFTVTIVGLANVVDGVGVGADPLRGVAIVTLLAFGVVMLMPGLAARLEAPLSRLGRFGPRSTGDGFRSGLLVGAALGFVYTPCASPILAAVISVSAASGKTIVIALAYSAGSALVLLALALGGRRVFDRVRRAGRGPLLQRALGVIMILTALAIATNLDVNFDQFVAEKIPDVNLTATLECSKTVTGRLHQITGRHAKFVAANGSSACGGSTTVHVAQTPARRACSPTRTPCPTSGPHLNSQKPRTGSTRARALESAADACLAARTSGAGRLLDVHVHQLHSHAALPEGVGCDLPQGRPGDRRRGDTRVRLREGGRQREGRDRTVRHPLPRGPGQQHGHLERLWKRRLAGRLPDRRRMERPLRGDRRGRLRKTETAIRALLAESGAQVGGKSHPTDVVVPSEEATPETYLGTNRAQGWINGPTSGTHDYGPPPTGELALNDFAYSGTWKIAGQPAEAVSEAGIDLEFEAKHVYLVLSSTGNVPRTVQVLLDGRPISAADAGSDVRDGVVTVQGERLYTLVSLPHDEQRRLSLRFAPGVTGYAFTFG